MSPAGLVFFTLLLFCLPQTSGAHSLYVSTGVEGAVVRLDGLEVGITDSLGVFFAEPVEPGRYLLEIGKQGRRAVRDSVTVPRGLTGNYITVLEPLRVIVVNEHTGLESDSVGGPYTVQVGAFRSVENARRLEAALRDGPYEPRLETAEARGVGIVHRVRLSVFTSLEEAGQAAAAVMKNLEQDVWIVGLDGRDWALQIGSFSSRRKAEELIARVARPGLYLWLEHIRPEGLFRVKAGYWAGRREAEEAAGRIATEISVRPLVFQVR